MIRRLLVILGALALVACAQGADEPDMDPALEAGREVYSSTCATCHGGNGEGGSAPTLDGVLTTFSQCDDQVEWISLGSQRFQEEIGETYGDTDKEITAVMPEFGQSLTETEIAQVAAFERHRFGGEDPASAMAGCGL
ncbi:MAG TPA: cytochrome c [Acidimicrobiia bacterium]